MVSGGSALLPDDVRRWFRRVTGADKKPPSARGWAMDILQFVRGLQKTDFTLAEVYAFAPQLAVLHPQNNNVKPKIRRANVRFSAVK